MFSPLFSIDGPWRGMLAIAPAPAPHPHLRSSLRHWQRLGITSVLSMLRPGERRGWDKEGEFCHDLGLTFYSIPITDHSVPAADEMPAIAAQLEAVEAGLSRGEKIVAHCFAGIGRSGMASAALLMIGGVSLDDAIALVSSARGLPCPETREQREWLREFDRHRRLSYT